MQNIYSNLSGIIRTDRYQSGAVHHCTLDAENEMATSCGTLIPRCGDMNVRRKNTSSLSFFENGALKRVALEQQTRVKTPLGAMPAELVTFYGSGALKRFFPLDGQISGYWSEQDEEGLLEALNLKLPSGDVTAKIIGCCFYESGAVKSLTLWPSQTIHVNTGFGPIAVRHGLSFYENGALKSLEPARITAVPTPIGLLKAYDAAANGINADVNSLELSSNGQIAALTVPYTTFTVQNRDGHVDTIEPVLTVNPLDDESIIELPVRIRFAEDSVIFSVNGKQSVFHLDARFTVEPKKCTQTSCKSCTACGLCRS